MSQKTLIIDCSLSEPPSEIHPFRDVTLYSKTFCFDDILLICPKGTRSSYWDWLKSYGAHDYISYLLTYSEHENGILMHPIKGDITIRSINYFNLNSVISILNQFKIK